LYMTMKTAFVIVVLVSKLAVISAPSRVNHVTGQPGSLSTGPHRADRVLLMRFTQFMFPRGTPKEEFIEMLAEIEKLASDLSDAGWSFEIECFPDTQLVHADCCDEEEPIADASCQNGPEVPVMIERLVRSAHASL
jgi:hypothetical protein